MTRIVLIGSGNVAYHLALFFAGQAMWDLTLVNTNSLRFPAEFDTLPVKKLIGVESIPANADYYGLCISDDALINFKMPVLKQRSLVFHLSGSQPLEILSKFSNYFGVLYPLYSFTKGQEIQWSQIPILTEASNVVSNEMLQRLALTLSNSVSYLDSEKRKKLHLAAIFSNNFINHLLYISNQLCQENQIQPNLLEPIIQQTIDKALKYGPESAQTGPAKRGDIELMKTHFEVLKEHPQWEHIYRSISESIQKTYE